MIAGQQTTAASSQQPPNSSPSESKSQTAGNSQQEQSQAAQPAQPKTYKEIRQRLAQQQYLQRLRLQQQQWIIQQQQLLLQNNPGITLDQVNAIIYQQLILQQQQHLQKVLALQEAVAKQEAALKQNAEEGSKEQGGNQALNDENLQMTSEEIRIQQQAMVQQHQHMLMTQSAFQQLVYQQHMQQQAQQQTRLQQSANGSTPAPNGQAQQTQQNQVLVMTNANGQMSVGFQNNATQQNATPGKPFAATFNSFVQLGTTEAAASNSTAQASNPKNTTIKDTTTTANTNNGGTTPSLVSYTQLLKQECQFEPLTYSNEVGMKLQLPMNSCQPTNLPFENLKHQFQQFTSDIVRKVLARSDSMNLLRQIIDLKARKVKPKNYESQIFLTICEKEQQRIHQENTCLQKNALKIEDKTLVKALQKNVKKMLKPFKGLQFDDFLNNEIHLNEIMQAQDQSKDPIKESRKRHLRILDAALKEQVVDMQIVLGICVQISRQAFFNELQDYYLCAHEFIMANQSQFPNHEIAGIQNLKKKLSAMKSNQKVSIQTTKKLDRMFWLLLEQNQDVQNNIKLYKEKFKQKTFEEKQAAEKEKETQKDAQRSNFFRRQQTGIRSSSGIGTNSPKVSSMSMSQHNILNSKQSESKPIRQNMVSGSNQASQDQGGSLRRQVTKNNRSSMHQQDPYQPSGLKANSQVRNVATASMKNTDIGAGDHANSNTKLSSQQYPQNSQYNEQHSQTLKNNPVFLNSKGTNKLAPLQNQVKKAQSLIQKKGKAKDLDQRILQAAGIQQQNNVERTPDHSSQTKKRLSSMNVHQVANTASKVLNLGNQPTPINGIHQPVVQNHRGRLAGQLNSSTTSNNDHKSATRGGNTQQAQPTNSSLVNQANAECNNSTENMFNLIQATKTKNTMILEPLERSSTEQVNNFVNDLNSPVSNEIGSGLRQQDMGQTEYENGFLSQPSRQQRQFIISSPSKGQLSQGGYQKFNIKLQSEGESQILRQWSRPQIQQAIANNSVLLQENHTGFKSIQVCTCQRFRKRIDISSSEQQEDTKAIECPRSVRDRPNKLQMQESEEGDESQGNDISERMSPSVIKIKNKVRHNNEMLRDSTHSELKQYHKKAQSSKANLENQLREVNTTNYRKIASPQDSRPPTSPSNKKARGHHPRGSLDFKMRILTKKKVIIPSTASNPNQHDESARNSEEPTSGQMSKISRIGSQSQFGNSTNSHVISTKAELMDGLQVPKQKVVTYEICQECGGQRPAGLPEVSQSALSEVKVKLQIDKIQQSGTYDSQTARIDGSDRSSTLSLGRRNEPEEQSQPFTKRRPMVQAYSAIINVQPLKEKDEQFRGEIQVKNQMFDRLNKKYLRELHIFDNKPLLLVAINYRAKIIQCMVRTRNYRKRVAITLLQKFWRRYAKKQKAFRQRMAEQEECRKKIAIRKIKEFSRVIKVRKVSASLMLNYHQINQSVQQAILRPVMPAEKARAEGENSEAKVEPISQAEAEKVLSELEVKLVKVQRLWRAKRVKQYMLGQKLLNLKNKRENLFNRVVNQKQRQTQNLNCELLHQYSMFTQEHQNLDCYFWKQMVSLSKDLELKSKKIQQKVASEFNGTEWTLNQLTKEWHNQSNSITIKLERGESSQHSNLKERLAQYYIQGQLPDEEAIQTQLDDLAGARNAMQTLLQREQDWKIKQLLTGIKKQRIENLYQYNGPLKMSGQVMQEQTNLDICP